MEIIVEPSRHFRDEISTAICLARPDDLIIVRSEIAAVLARAVAANLKREIRVECRED